MNALPAILWIAAALCAVMVCAVTVHCSHFGRADVVVKPVSWAVIIGQLTTFVLFAMPYFLFLANKDSIGTHPRSLYERLMALRGGCRGVGVRGVGAHVCAGSACHAFRTGARRTIA